jgi:hypothetical protein
LLQHPQFGSSDRCRCRKAIFAEAPGSDEMDDEAVEIDGRGVAVFPSFIAVYGTADLLSHGGNSPWAKPPLRRRVP